jgi:hypothetical protein
MGKLRGETSICQTTPSPKVVTDLVVAGALGILLVELLRASPPKGRIVQKTKPSQNRAKCVFERGIEYEEPSKTGACRRVHTF